MLNEKTINYILVILTIILTLIIIFKFIIKDNKASLSINVKKITISSLDGSQIKLFDMIKDKKEIYILLFKLNDCYTCVAKGLADIQNLSRSGSNYICIIAHDSLDDIKGFAETFPEIIFHQITTKEQYENIRCPYFPVIAKLNNKKIVNYRFITP